MSWKKRAKNLIWWFLLIVIVIGIVVVPLLSALTLYK